MQGKRIEEALQMCGTRNVFGWGRYFEPERNMVAYHCMQAAHRISLRGGWVSSWVLLKTIFRCVGGSSAAAVGMGESLRATHSLISHGALECLQVLRGDTDDSTRFLQLYDRVEKPLQTFTNPFVGVISPRMRYTTFPVRPGFNVNSRDGKNCHATVHDEERGGEKLGLRTQNRHVREGGYWRTCLCHRPIQWVEQCLLAPCTKKGVSGDVSGLHSTGTNAKALGIARPTVALQCPLHLQEKRPKECDNDEHQAISRDRVQLICPGY
ncbi:uncharacterized protein EI90DRAFT_3020157 [Cantharellus anzutake]|uniref:uncharacterized protein n=1 Tax=Cantharellus anzutake TaxID=1750568 RepID=UPI0019043E46|nr:uncharacterized protein EI90DRAFT_3020157 [Cantharellus anzutake]KAF8321987.1 hypothetical protein EI90DRAFT_3020157 [Cantharellus anzutake]